MRVPRIYTPNSLQPNSTITLDTQYTHYLSRVLRLKAGATLTIFNGQGGEYQASLSEIKKREATVEIGEFVDRKTESPLCIHLGQGISRGEKMDYTIQKAVELGVTEITPLITEFCGVKLSGERFEKRLAHWEGVIISACEQSGRNILPTIHPPQTIEIWLKNHTGVGLVLDPCGEQTINDLPSDISALSLLIGPEGGLSDSELIQAQQNNLTSIKLGPRILRTETAGLAVTAILQAKYGDMYTL